LSKLFFAVFTVLMNMEGLLKTVGIIMLVLYIAHFISSSLRVHRRVEGMTVGSMGSMGSKPFVASSATELAKQIAFSVVKEKDTLNIQKYRKDYENVIEELQSYCEILMVKEVCKGIPGDDDSSTGNMLATMSNLVKYNEVIKALKDTMIYLDKTRF